MKWCLVLAAAVAAVSADPIIYFREQFEDGDDWQKRWIPSKNKSDYGKWQLSAGKFWGDPEKDKGIQTTENWKYYALSARFDPIGNENQSLVIQFTVKHEQEIDCGGGYVKIYPADTDQEKISGHSLYCIMFGPDICGTIHEKVHVILNYKERYYPITRNITCKHDEITHLYTLIIRPNNTYAVKIDNEVVMNGTLEDDFAMLLPRKIQDTKAKQPRDWDDRERIEDPNEIKPADWDEREFIEDPEAREPRDWDSAMDGQWEPPIIPNPKYRGIWVPKIIDNLNYQGVWVQPYIDNPDYVPDDELYRYEELGVIGLDLWQVKSGTIFDNFLITNDEELAERIGYETWGETREPELKMKTIQDEERDAKDEKKQRWKKLEEDFAKLEEMEKLEKERQVQLRRKLREDHRKEQEALEKKHLARHKYIKDEL
ncbi:calreticulin-like [Hyperolius riggenbachi]|uniref:calreticulin-like n=1 Tax=Hyperolius riggenbachi TaxID=752182 RepID=UPI0035A35A81